MIDPKINLAFNGIYSLLFIAGLLAAFIGWVTYIALSVRHIRSTMSTMMTRAELSRAFEDFKRELEK